LDRNLDPSGTKAPDLPIEVAKAFDLRSLTPAGTSPRRIFASAAGPFSATLGILESDALLATTQAKHRPQALSEPPVHRSN